MAWRLREGVYWCDCGGRAVFLDLNADLYFCLRKESNAAFLRMVNDEPQPCDPELLEPLLRRGLLVEGDDLQLPPAVEVPESDFEIDTGARPHLFDIVRAICCEVRTQWFLRRRSLHRVIERVRRTEPMRRLMPRDEHRSIQALVTAASASALVLRSHDRCLVRGLAFHSSCRKRGLKTKLVLGVIAHPFTAHCWVQFGSVVLIGGYEQARLYTPILVVE